jgi:hypothetical protein
MVLLKGWWVGFALSAAITLCFAMLIAVSLGLILAPFALIGWLLEQLGLGDFTRCWDDECSPLSTARIYMALTVVVPVGTLFLLLTGAAERYRWSSSISVRRYSPRGLIIGSTTWTILLFLVLVAV